MTSKYIVFDLFGVLLSRSFVSGADKLSVLLGRPADEIAPVYKRWEHPWDKGQIDEEAFWAAVQHDLSTTVEWRLLRQAVLESIRPLPGSLELLERCRQHAEVHLLSDTRREWFEYLDARYGLQRRVERVFLSYEIGFTKAEVEPFRYLLSELGCLPEEVFFLDDNPANITVARSLGIQALVFTNATAAEQELRRISRLWRSWPENPG